MPAAKAEAEGKKTAGGKKAGYGLCVVHEWPRLDERAPFYHVALPCQEKPHGDGDKFERHHWDFFQRVEAYCSKTGKDAL